MLQQIIPRTIEVNPDFTVLLIGANSDSFRESILRQNPALATRVVATGALSSEEVSVAISSCDVMAQPYPDGVTARRTSMMAALSHGRAIVTTHGPFTERIWQQSEASVLVRTSETSNFVLAISDLVKNEARRRRYEKAARILYANRFDLRHTIEALRIPNLR